MNKSISFSINHVEYKLESPEWWDEIEVDISNLDFSDQSVITNYCKEAFGADTGTKSTWKLAFKAHALYCSKYSVFPVYLAHCAKTGEEFVLASKIYADLFHLVYFFGKNVEWHHTYLAYSAAGAYEKLKQYSLAISWFEKATKYLAGAADDGTKYYASEAIKSIERIKNTADYKDLINNKRTANNNNYYFYIFYKNDELKLDDAELRLKEANMSVQRYEDVLKISYDQGPTMFVSHSCEDHALKTSQHIRSKTKHKSLMNSFDSLYKVSFNDLEEVLDEINTLIDVQCTLRDLTDGVIYNSWNQEIINE